MLYAPIHPADVYFWRGINSYWLGMYGLRPALPSWIGFEGVGVIKDADDKSLIN